MLNHEYFAPRQVYRYTTDIIVLQEISKNDSYCWVCHDGGDVLCCDKCPRVFHIQCSGLPKAPEGDEEWFCPVCKVSNSSLYNYCVNKPSNVNILHCISCKLLHINCAKMDSDVHVRARKKRKDIRKELS